MNIQQQLGMRIAYLRKQKKWTQEDLAFYAQVNKNYISDLENGRKNPSVEILSRIAEALSITMEFLFKGIQPFEE